MEASRLTSPAPVETAAASRGGVRQVVADYVQLTKPRVQLLLLLTTVATMEIAGDPSIGLILLTLILGTGSLLTVLGLRRYERRGPRALRPV